MPNGPMMAPPMEDDMEEMEDNEMESESGEYEDSKSALLPKSIFDGEVKAGDSITLTVNQVFGDEVEVSVGSESSPAKSPPAPTADEEIEAASTEIV